LSTFFVLKGFGKAASCFSDCLSLFSPLGVQSPTKARRRAYGRHPLGKDFPNVPPKPSYPNPNMSLPEAVLVIKYNQKVKKKKG